MPDKTLDPAILFAEFIGTIIYGYGAAVSFSNPFATAGSLYLAMAFTGYLSTPQFNPAVTLAMILRKVLDRDFEFKDSLQYIFNILAQLAGAVVATLLAWSTSHQAFYYRVQGSFNNTEGFFAEVVYSAVICATCLTVKKVTESLLLSGIAISISCFIGNLAVSRITLACFNPAFGFCFNLIHYMKEGDHFTDTWIYILAPLFGSIIGTGVAYIFLKVDEEDIDNTRTKSLEGRIAT